MRFNSNGNLSNKIYFLYDAIKIFYKLKNYYSNFTSYDVPKTKEVLLDEYLSSYCKEFLPLRLIAINSNLYHQKVELHPFDDYDDYDGDYIVIKLVFPELGISQVIKVEKDSDRMSVI